VTPIRGGTTVERDRAGRHRSVSVVTDEDGDAGVWIDGFYIGGIYRAFVREGQDDEWIVCPRGSSEAINETFTLGCEAVEALLEWHYENGDV
jgi:hypothetical protein